MQFMELLTSGKDVYEESLKSEVSSSTKTGSALGLLRRDGNPLGGATGLRNP